MFCGALWLSGLRHNTINQGIEVSVQPKVIQSFPISLTHSLSCQNKGKKPPKYLFYGLSGCHLSL